MGMEAGILILPAAIGEGSTKEVILCWGLEAERQMFNPIWQASTQKKS